MSGRIVSIDSRRSSPWRPEDGCDCSACEIQRIGADMHERLVSAPDLITLEAQDAMRHFLDRLGALCGTECHYERQA